MKKFLAAISLLLLFNCSTTEKGIATQSNSEEEEWEVVVFDVDYENFLNSRARPRSMYSEAMLKNRNSFLVTEWNTRVNQPRYNRNVYENMIQYNPQEEYGFEFEYRLYQAFVYVSWRYGEQFNGISNTEFVTTSY